MAGWEVILSSLTPSATDCRLAVTRLVCVGFICLFAQSAVGQVIVGHRGASFDAPENTLSAFRLAWEQDADGIEGDFYVTKDNQVVCIHDADTKRTAGKALKIVESTLAELRQLEYGRWKDQRFAGEPLPTFDEVLKIVPAGKLFVIELKTGPEIVPLIKPALDAAIKANSGQQFLFISFKEDTVALCKELFPAIRAHWLTGFKQDKVTKKWAPDVDKIVETVRRVKADGVGLQGNTDLIDQAFIDRLKSGGCKEFHVWTIDEPKDARLFQSLGAVGITTNKPALIRQTLANSTSNAPAAK